MARTMRVFLTALTYLASLLGVAAVSFIVVIVLAGPHAGLLPHWLEAVVLGLGWLAVLVLPILAARTAWRRLGKHRDESATTR